MMTGNVMQVSVALAEGEWADVMWSMLLMVGWILGVEGVVGAHFVIMRRTFFVKASASEIDLPSCHSRRICYH